MRMPARRSGAQGISLREMQVDFAPGNGRCTGIWLYSQRACNSRTRCKPALRIAPPIPLPGSVAHLIQRGK